MALGLQSLVLLSLLVVRLTCFPNSGAKSNSSGCGNAHTKAVIVSLWRMTPHLRPKLHRCPHHTLPNGFWLLLLAGDVELNPGPVRFPCTVCQKPVKCNQRGIQCSICDNWTHAKCGSVSIEEYVRLGEREDDPWVCPSCVISELPFADASLTSVVEDNERGASFGVDKQCPIMSMLNNSPCTVKVAHLNVRSLLPKMDLLRDAFARCQQGQVPHYINLK